MQKNQPFRSRSYSIGNPPISHYVSDQYISSVPGLQHHHSHPISFPNYNETREIHSGFSYQQPPKKKRLHSYQGQFSPRYSQEDGYNKYFRATSLPPHQPAPYQKSIVASLDMVAPLENRTCPCEHYGAQWEDCRIVIHCFGLRRNGNKCANSAHISSRINERGNKIYSLPKSYRNQLFIKYGGDCPSIHPAYTYDQKSSNTLQPERSKSKSVCARSVRLSIVPLNPIYRRIHNLSPEPVGFKTSKHLGNRSLSKQAFIRYWKKRLIQRMAFKIDDFTIQEDQVKVAKDVFKRFDKRGQDKISTTDLGPAFRALNLTVKPDTLKEWADQVDDDATGFIDFNGFLICYGKKLQEDQDERDLRDAFRVLDKNKRGEIDVEDLRWILKGLGDDLTEEEIDDMIRDTDTDGSGFVDFDEFYKLMTSE